MDDLYKANLILNDIFIFDEDGDMEKSKVEVPNKPFNWDFSANDDQEWTFMLNRFTFLELLTRAYKMSSEKKYINKGRELIKNWIENVELIPSKKTRTLDTGMRIYHFIKFVEDNEIDGDFLKLVDKSVYDQVIYLKEHYIEKYDLSNWGMVQAIAISVAGIHLNNPKMYELARKKLNEMISIQYIDQASIHWEKCVGYHNFMTLWLLRLAEYEKKHGLEISFKEKIKNIVQTSDICTDLDGLSINNGDSDLVKTDFLIKMYENIFDEKLEEKKKKFFKNYGLYVNKNETSMLSCLNQSMSSNHTHADFTHFNYQFKNLRVRDGGRYTYTESEERKYFKLFAHNNIVVDDSSSMGYVNSWETSYYPIINPIYVYEEKDTFVEMSYYDDVREIFSKRRLFYLENGDLIVFDQVKAKGSHKATTTFLIDNFNSDLFKTNKEYKVSNGNYSPEYNELKSCDEIRIEEEFKDSYTQCIVLGDASKYEFVEIKRNFETLSEEQGLAVCKNGIVYANIFEEITDSPRVFKVNDIKFHARAAVLRSQTDLSIYR